MPSGGRCHKRVVAQTTAANPQRGKAQQRDINTEIVTFGSAQDIHQQLLHLLPSWPRVRCLSPISDDPACFLRIAPLAIDDVKKCFDPAMAASDGASSISVAIRVRPFTASRIPVLSMLLLISCNRSEKLRNSHMCLTGPSSWAMARLPELQHPH